MVTRPVQRGADYDQFEQTFGSDDFLVVTWDGCSIDDPRLPAFAQAIRNSDPQGLIQNVTTGEEVVERLTRDTRMSRSTILKRLQGIFFGLHDPSLDLRICRAFAAWRI